MSVPHGKINFPLYSVVPLSCNHVVVGGGGGSASTGVFNGFVICEIGYENNGYVAFELQRYSTSSAAVMNCAIGSYNRGKKIFLAVGKDSDCHVYQIKVAPPPDLADNVGAGNDGIRHRGTTSNGSVPGLHHEDALENANASSKRHSVSDLVFDIGSICSAQTDFSMHDPCQNVVIFSHDARLILTGGVDGTLRVWNFPEMKEKLKIEASKKEIADLDISSDRKLVSCVSRDGKCKIWSLTDGKLKVSLDLPPEDDGKYLYKKGKFGVIEDKGNINRLFVILNPTSSKNKSYIQHWTGPNFSLTKIAQAGEPLSALAVSRCGKFIAVGSMTTGDVDIYIGFSLQKLRHIEKAHKNFVTGLAFLPPALHSEESVLAECDAAVVSISIDNQILVHHVEQARGMPVWLAVVLCVAVLVLTFIFCSYIGL